MTKTLFSLGTASTRVVLQWASYQLQLTSENCSNSSVSSPLLCKSGTPTATQVLDNVSKLLDYSIVSDTEKHLLSNSEGFEKMLNTGNIVFLSESFISRAVYFAEFNFQHVV